MVRADPRLRHDCFNRKRALFAASVCHVFHPIAEGQIRGVPWVAPAMVRLWLLDQYDDACDFCDACHTHGLTKLPRYIPRLAFLAWSST